MHTLDKDDFAPDFVLQTIEGQSVSLQQSLQGKNSILLVFLRHLG
jgi:peroxiredoxin